MRLATVDGNWPIPPLHRLLVPPEWKDLASFHGPVADVGVCALQMLEAIYIGHGLV